MTLQMMKGARLTVSTAKASTLMAVLAMACWAMPARATETLKAYAAPGSGVSGDPVLDEVYDIASPTQTKHAAVSGASATSSLVHVHAGTDDTTHWVNGPYANALSHVTFGVAGTGPQTVTFAVQASGTWLRQLSQDFVMSAEFSAELTGNSGPGSLLFARVVEVNCIGCGGHLGAGSYQYTRAGVVEESGSLDGITTLQGNWLLTTTLEAGVAHAGSLRLATDGSAGSSGWESSLTVTDIVDGTGQRLAFSQGTDGNWWLAASATSPIAAVPEPETWALMMVGLGVVGSMARRRSAQRSS